MPDVNRPYVADWVSGLGYQVGVHAKVEGGKPPYYLKSVGYLPAQPSQVPHLTLAPSGQLDGTLFIQPGLDVKARLELTDSSVPARSSNNDVNFDSEQAPKAPPTEVAPVIAINSQLLAGTTKRCYVELSVAVDGGQGEAREQFLSYWRIKGRTSDPVIDPTYVGPFSPGDTAEVWVRQVSPDSQIGRPFAYTSARVC